MATKIHKTKKCEKLQELEQSQLRIRLESPVINLFRRLRPSVATFLFVCLKHENCFAYF